ncbi:hypothetical protein CRG98_023005 [Punica granatum]|uniref:FAF domain-containing protein n=1 Tax=Punica granatum TaxID=22663 RepID=A0A2I0JK37_PUNGR|nr:hypothetical protein CRG98_023005 [Punica granatum]
MGRGRSQPTRGGQAWAPLAGPMAGQGPGRANGQRGRGWFCVFKNRLYPDHCYSMPLVVCIQESMLIDVNVLGHIFFVAVILFIDALFIVFISVILSLPMDDMIGTESGAHWSSNEEDMVQGVEKIAHMKTHAREWPAKRNQYPPPIPLLARSANLQGRMPWVLTRHYDHGKLILREEPVRHHEYFEAYREDSRLFSGSDLSRQFSILPIPCR